MRPYLVVFGNIVSINNTLSFQRFQYLLYWWNNVIVTYIAAMFVFDCNLSSFSWVLVLNISIDGFLAINYNKTTICTAEYKKKWGLTIFKYANPYEIHVIRIMFVTFGYVADFNIIYWNKFENAKWKLKVSNVALNSDS